MRIGENLTRAARKSTCANSTERIPDMSVFLLLKKNRLLLVIAFSIGSALSYIAISKYVETMIYHAPLASWIFLLAVAPVTLISLATSGWQVYRAVQIYPAEIIKSE